jgi:hypothetical protein
MLRGKSLLDWNGQVLSEIARQLAEFRRENIKSTLRGMFYALVAIGIIPNIQEVYKGLSSHTARWRESGVLPKDCFTDDTRAEFKDFNDKYRPIADYIELGAAFLNTAKYTYEIPRWHKQPNHVEIWLEKDASKRTVVSIVEDLDVTVVPNRGYSSIPYFNENVKRLKEKQAEGKEIWIFYCGDCDPSGETMDQVYKRKFEEYGLYNVNFVRLTVTMEQVRRFNLLADPDPLTRDKLERDPNRFKFMEKYHLTKISNDPDVEYIQRRNKKTGKLDNVIYSYVIKEIVNEDGTTSYVKHDPTKLFAVEFEAMQAPNVRPYLKELIRNSIESKFDKDIYKEVQNNKPTPKEIDGLVLSKIRELEQNLSSS